jgi:hypothetical protein
MVRIHGEALKTGFWSIHDPIRLAFAVLVFVQPNLVLEVQIASPKKWRSVAHQRRGVAMARSRRKKTTKDRLIEAALYAAPAPVRTIASNPTGFRFIMIAGAILMATGILTLDWRDGMPQFKFHRDKASQVKQDLVNDIGSKVQGWSPLGGQGAGNPPGVFIQAPFNPYPQPAQQPAVPQYGQGVPMNQPAWGQNQGQANGYYNPNVPQTNPYPPSYGGQTSQNPQFPNSPPPQWSNQQWANQQAQNPQWPNQTPPYAPNGNAYPGGYRK